MLHEKRGRTRLQNLKCEIEYSLHFSTKSSYQSKNSSKGI